MQHAEAVADTQQAERRMEAVATVRPPDASGLSESQRAHPQREAEQALATQHGLHQQQAVHALTHQQAQHLQQMQQALGTQQVQHKHNLAQIFSAFNAESMKLSEHSMKLNNMSRSVRAKEQSTQDARVKTQMKRQSEQIEGLKQQVKQSETEMDQSIKLVQNQPTSQGGDVKPTVEKISEEIREKGKQKLRCHSSTTAH